MDWEVEELGIRRFPTTVLASMREGTGAEWTDALAAMAFHREARRQAAEIGETLVHPLGDYGVLLLTSANPESGEAQAAEEIRAKAAAFSASMSRRFDCRVWVGIGNSDSSGQALRTSYHEAITSLHLAVASDREVVRYRDLVPVVMGETELRRKVAALAEAMLEHGGPPTLHQATAFIRDLLVQTRGRPDTARRAFIEVLHRLLGGLETRRVLPPDDLVAWESKLVLGLETAGNLRELLARFRSALEQLASFLARPERGDKFLRLSRAAEAVDLEPQARWSLPGAAKRFGFSTSSFSREFRRHAGTAFSDYVIQKRLEKAKRLLAEGLSPSRTAEICGFSSANYFTQIFKRKVGAPPGRFGKNRGV